MKLYKTLILLVFCTTILSAQSNDASLKKLKYLFDTFQFREFINSADSLVKKDTALSLVNTNTILKMKGIAYFYLWQEDSSAMAFREVLKTEPQYEPDTVTTSPKIVSFFRKVKEEFLRTYKPPVAQEKKDTIPKIVQTIPKDTAKEVLRDTLKFLNQKEAQPDFVPAFALLPGYVQILRGNTTKGWVFAGGAALSGVLSVVFSLDAGTKEKNYLNSVTKTDISSRYEAYNRAYKIRNYAFSAFIAFFAGSLVDNYLSLPSGLSVKGAYSGLSVNYRLNF